MKNTHSTGYKILCLVDHRSHKAHESLYPLLSEMRLHPTCNVIDVASRANRVNDPCFLDCESTQVAACRVGDNFVFEPDTKRYHTGTFEVDLKDYDLILLRLAKPNPKSFFDFLESVAGPERILNRPSGILKAGSKDYLVNFPGISPVMRLCSSSKEVEAFKELYQIVLKPLNEAGGRGIVRIDNDTVWKGMQQISWNDFLPELESNLRKEPYLAMEFLHHNAEGDKRIIVVNGKVVAAALRLPAQGSWLCNVSMGGRSVPSKPDEDELKIAALLIPQLMKLGVILFGFDTLKGNHGKRVLSEINASNPGGLLPAEQESGMPVIKPASDLLWDYILTHIQLN